MAECTRFACDHCGHAVEAWSDGNPYYRDAAGRKHYAHHPDHDALARCTGNDVPHLCLICGAARTVDSAQRARPARCRRCGGSDLVPMTVLAGRACPSCRAGTFAADPRFFAIS